MTRKFELKPGKRANTPLLVALSGPSSSGKTYSALRLATGIQRVTGGKIAVIDTESSRALHYADDFDFHHLDLKPPFDPLSYLAAVEHCAAQGAKVVIVDSFTHEHEGPGGVLEMHDQYLDEKAGNDFKKRDRLNFAAWAKPKQQRRRMIDGILQSGVNLISCFRAKPKLKIAKGQEPIERGFQPIGAEELVFEMTLSVLLHPGAGGVPTWQPEIAGEQMLIKLPKQFVPMFKGGGPLSEDIGEGLARWAAGDAQETTTRTREGDSQDRAEPPPATGPTNDAMDELIEELYGAGTLKDVKAIAGRHRDLAWSDEQRGMIRKAIELREKELRERKPA